MSDIPVDSKLFDLPEDSSHLSNPPRKRKTLNNSEVNQCTLKKESKLIQNSHLNENIKAKLSIL